MASLPTTQSGERSAKPRRSLKSHERRVGFAFALPSLIAFFVVILIPFLQSLKLSFYRYTIEMDEPKFIGLKNFKKLLSNPDTLSIWFNTLIFVVLTTSITLVLGLAWAMVLNQSFRGKVVLRALSLLPWVLPSTVTAFLAAWIFNGQYGILNAILLQLGIIHDPVPWLAEAHSAMAAVILTRVWVSVPLFMAFFLAGLQGVSQDQMDAARVDGCENLAMFRYVVLPHLAPTIIIVTILGAMSNLQAFDVIYALTQGGPVKATTMLSIEVYKEAFQNWDIGSACSIGVLWFVTIAIPSIFYLRILFKREK
ncbi:multiple sugar transport system permease protein [Paraburkholderia sp. GAS41]|jgi:multiple sugar transport system permease protein|uniref:carbohydrate ABC transporter permease n=1 Tax=Paraburkholderia sp. GAS41 TaxID=3035134 RepID=UPI003D1E2D9B